MRQVGFHIDRDAVKADPAPQFDTNGSDFIFARRAVGAGGAVGAGDPDPHPPGPPFAADVEGGKGADHPSLQRLHEQAHVAAPGVEVKHHIGHPLTGAVIGILPAAPGGEHGKAVRFGQVGGPGGGACGVKRRVFQEPDRLGCAALGDGGGAGLHLGEGVQIGGKAGKGGPFGL